MVIDGFLRCRGPPCGAPYNENTACRKSVLFSLDKPAGRTPVFPAACFSNRNSLFAMSGAVVRSRKMCTPAAVPRCGEVLCAALPPLPSPGALMPVYWSPAVATSVSTGTYTCLLISTEDIAQGITLRFQMWPSDTPYASALSGSALVQWDLVVTTPIPAATVLTLAMTSTYTALWGPIGSSAVYASGGSGIAAGYFGPYNSLMCLAFAPASGPTSSGVTTMTPQNGRAIFAIGFYIPATTGGACADTVLTPDQATMPNFPDQYSTYAYPWTIEYSVVFPTRVPVEVSSTPECIAVNAIKFDQETYVQGSWTQLRSAISQPWTVITSSFSSVNKWSFAGTYGSPTPIPYGFAEDDYTVGPFNFSVMAGQLVPVYFRPRAQDIHTVSDPLPPSSAVPPPLITDSGSAQLGLLVTSPIPANVSVYFTREEFNVAAEGFGDLNQSGQFTTTQPSFTWTTNAPIPAGTVLFIDGIGAAAPTTITIRNAHDSFATNVGAITSTINTSPDGMSVTSIIAVGVWTQASGVNDGKFSDAIMAGRFVCAVLSTQYAGDFPLLAPQVTVNPRLFVAQGIYGQGETFIYPPNRDGTPSFPPPALAPIINGATFTPLPFGTIVNPTTLPVFLGLSGYVW